jgi:hypothetical protein
MSPHHRAILVAVRDYWAQHGIAPTYRELCEMTGRASVGGLHFSMVHLIENGYLTHRHSLPRTLKLTEKGKKEIS